MLRGEDRAKPKADPEDERKVKDFIQSAAVRARMQVKYVDRPLVQKAYYKDGVIYINKNRPMDEGVKVTMAHELYHAMEGTKEHEAIVKLAFEGKDAEAMIAEKIEKYRQNGVELDETGARAEIGAEFIEKALTDEATINQVLLEDRTLAAKILERIKEIIAVYKAKKDKNMSAAEAREYAALLKARRLYEDGLEKLHKGENSPAGVERARYQSERMGGYFPDNEVSTKDVDAYNIKNINNKYEVIGKLKDALSKTYLSTESQSKPITNLDTGMEIEIRQGGLNETFGNDKYYLNLSEEAKLAKIATMSKLANLIKYGEVRAEEAANYHNQNSKVRYAYLTAPIKIDGQEYMVNMDIRKSPNGENRFYIHSLNIKKDADSLLPSMRVVKGENQTSINSIPNSNENVKERFALDEKTETPEFKRWFGDSKVVDENGKPKVMYHGSREKFTAMDKEKGGLLYFADKKYIAVGYATGSGGAEVYSVQATAAADGYVNLTLPYVVRAFANCGSLPTNLPLNVQLRLDTTAVTAGTGNLIVEKMC